MKKISEYCHNELGKILCCESDREYKGDYWCKKEKLRFFSKELQYIHILFDLYNYDSNFKMIDEECKEKTLQEEKKIVENYKLFLNSLEEIEKFCLTAFQNKNETFIIYTYNTLDTLDMDTPNYDLSKVTNMEELCQYVRVAQVYVSSECYEVRLQFLYSYYDIVIYGYLNDNGEPKMDIKSALDIIRVNPIIGT